MRIHALILLVALPSLAAADPAPSAAERKQYAELLHKGRALEDAGKLAEAAKAFQDCLIVAPEDATALSELALVQFRLKDPAAEVTAIKAVARAEVTNLRAASLYNLGIILQARNDKYGAIAALEESLRLRPNATVEKTLSKLDPAAVARVRTGPRAMTGPLAVGDPSGAALRKEMCWQSLNVAWPELGATAEDMKDHITCTETKIPVPAGSAILDAQVWETIGSFQYPKQTDTLAVRTAAGWYTTTFEAFWSNRWTDGTAKVTHAQVTDLGGSKGISIRWELQVNEWPWDPDGKRPEEAEGRDVTSSYMLVAGVGTSGAPSATPKIPLGIAAKFGAGDDASVQLGASFSPKGELVLDGPTTAPTKAAKKKYADLVTPLIPGRFLIVFP